MHILTRANTSLKMSQTDIDKEKIMAKKSKVADEPKVIEEEVVTSPKEDDVDVFIREQLKVINNMSDKAKARRLAARVLRNKRKG